jgi:transcriptional regulator with XRE-family HTH domain
MTGQVDLEHLYDALDTQREARGLTWREAAKEIGVSPSTLTRLGQGASPDVEGFAKMAKWLNASLDDFLVTSTTQSAKRAAKSPPNEELLVVVSRHLRASKELDPRSAKALENIIQAAYKQMKELKQK